ncbi:hypothetical protein J4H92_01255 [Leucobacter weissii]|uniref:Uncharacterized protein n=1 Tax=Leucobacter weissii TaxID=1983706 RepID=A0A939MGQ0_9MICO|nr:DUF6541 family protein [Leucobacter weissii]MBO1900573.1 hypothetical protein [Leucobacter weissii]
MNHWIAAVPALLSAIALITVPGLPAALALRLRGLALLAASVAASFAAIAVAALAAPLLGLSWGVLPVLGVAGAAALLCALLRLAIPAPAVSAAVSAGRRSPAPRRAALALGGALLIAAAVIGQELVRAIGDPTLPSQTYDGVFHLGAVAQILETGDASPLHMNLANPERESVFYPTLWHATVALVAQLSGAGIAVASNATALAVAAWAWPVAILFFAAPFFARRPAHLLLGGALAAAFTAFPYLLLAWGVLSPNFLATALVPVVLGAAHLALRPGMRRPRPGGSAAVHRVLGLDAPPAALWTVAAAATGAAALAHPNALFGIAALIVPLLVVTALELRRARTSRQPALAHGPTLTRRAALLRWAGLAAAGLGILLLWSTVATTEQRRAEGHAAIALLDALGNAPMLGSTAWFTTVLVLGGAGLLLAFRRHRWLLGSYAILLVLYAAATGLSGPVRDFLTGGWYSDAARLAALLPVIALPLAGVAAALLFDLVVDGLRALVGTSGDAVRGGRRDLGGPSSAARRILPAAGGVAVIALLLFGGRGDALAEQSGWISDQHAISEESPLLDPDEYALLQRLDQQVPDGALIAGDPWTGTAFASSLAGRDVLFPHLSGNFGDAAEALAADLRDLDGPAACALLGELDVAFVLDFRGPVLVSDKPEVAARFAGLRDVGASPALEPVDREGDATLYRVAC